MSRPVDTLDMAVSRALRAGLALTSALLLVNGCSTPQVDVEQAAQACRPPAGPLAPADGGVHFGVNLDWGRETLAEYAERLGSRPAVAVTFTGLPLSSDDERNVDAAVEQVREVGALLLLTLEPHDGLGAVTEEVATDLAHRLNRYNRQGVPVVARIAHEMNGSWYPWSQQPAAYTAAFGRVADALHAHAPGSATMWAPNYGGGYPFPGGRFAAAADAVDALDSDRDGALTAADDPYAPYWPGADAVDWVGMSLYHWGSSYPWGENEVPEPGKFLAQLTGTYVGLGGDDSAVPDFYAVYGEQHGKPVAVPETAALYRPDGGGEPELAVKQAWWRQVLDPSLPRRLPRLAMVNWFEWDKHEPEVAGRVDWTATTSADVRAAFTADLPEHLRSADGSACSTP